MSEESSRNPHKSPPDYPVDYPDKRQQADADEHAAGSNPNKEYGEGNYKAARQYNEATREFAQSGKVEPAAEEARPRSPQEARELAEAEAKGRSHSKGEDAPPKPSRRGKAKRAA